MVIERVARKGVVEQGVVVESVMVPERRLGAVDGLGRGGIGGCALLARVGIGNKVGIRQARRGRFGFRGLFRLPDPKDLVRGLPLVEPGRPQKIAGLEIAPLGKQGQFAVGERSMLLPLPAQIPARFRGLRVVLVHACILHGPSPKPQRQGLP